MLLRLEKKGLTQEEYFGWKIKGNKKFKVYNGTDPFKILCKDKKLNHPDGFEVWMNLEQEEKLKYLAKFERELIKVFREGYTRKRPSSKPGPSEEEQGSVSSTAKETQENSASLP